jgi:hypothetical protein
MHEHTSKQNTLHGVPEQSKAAKSLFCTMINQHVAKSAQHVHGDEVVADVLDRELTKQN